MLVLPSLEIDTATRVQILDKIVRISHSTNTLGKDINSTIFSPTMGKEGKGWVL